MVETPRRPETMYTVLTQSAAETRALGARLGRLLRAGDVVRLQGDLGAGKTTFVQGVVGAMVQDMVQGMVQGKGGGVRVTSPTFTLVNEYSVAGGLTVHHMDAYRLGMAEAGEQVVDTLGLADLLEGDSVLLVEWSERIAALLPEEALTVHFDYAAGDDERTLTFTATGPRATALLRAFE